ncbi:MAG: HD domain-containing phosphohydrolase [Planctomycetota bacterium]
MEAKLISIIGLNGQEEIPLVVDHPIVLGRGDSATIRLMHSKVSRTHCRVAFENGFYTVEDLDSKNGTWVNNRRIHKAILFHHDRITVGGAEFRFVLEAGLTEESTNISVRANGEGNFGTEIKEPATVHTPSSLLLEMPRGEAMGAQEALERDLSAVCRIINSVNAQHHLDRLLETIMDSVMEVSGADRGYLIAAKKLGGVLMPLVSRNKDGIPTFARNTFSRSIVSECYEEGCAILRADPTSDYDASESMVVQQIQSIMCVPMRDEQGPVGVIYVDNIVGSRQFTKRDLKVLSAIGNQAGIAIRRAQLARQVETLFRDSMRTVISLVEIKDTYTYGHSERVTGVALRLAELLPGQKPDLRDIEIAGLLHDVGKLAVRLDILRKPDSLTDSEYAAVKEHPVAGASVLNNVDNAEHIAAAIRHHHEWWDGSGYPDGLAGEQIPLLSRLLAIADAFDSMASERPYKSMLPQNEILAELSGGSGTQFDPTLVDLFVDALTNDESFRNRVNAIYRHSGNVGQGKGPFD